MKNIKDIIVDDLRITNFHENEWGGIEADWFGEQSKIHEALEANGLKEDQCGAIGGIFDLQGKEAGDNCFEGTLNVSLI